MGARCIVSAQFQPRHWLYLPVVSKQKWRKSYVVRENSIMQLWLWLWPPTALTTINSLEKWMIEFKWANILREGWPKMIAARLSLSVSHTKYNKHKMSVGGCRLKSWFQSIGEQLSARACLWIHLPVIIPLLGPLSAPGNPFNAHFFSPLSGFREMLYDTLVSCLRRTYKKQLGRHFEMLWLSAVVLEALCCQLSVNHPLLLGEKEKLAQFNCR